MADKWFQEQSLQRRDEPPNPDKCDDCPLYKACGWHHGKEFNVLIQPACFSGGPCDPTIPIPASFAIVRAMLAGEWKCEKCGYIDKNLCSPHGRTRKVPCASWQDRGKGE